MKFFEKITSADNAEYEVYFDNFSGAGIGYSELDVYIHVNPNNVGTIQFSVEEDIVASHQSWVAGSKIPCKINNLRDLRYKASAAGQSFVVTK